MRSRIILSCGSGKNNSMIASELGLCNQTIGKWRTRFLEQRLDGLLDEPRPGAPRLITDAEVEKVVTLSPWKACLPMRLIGALVLWRGERD
jgi:transposase